MEPEAGLCGSGFGLLTRCPGVRQFSLPRMLPALFPSRAEAITDFYIRRWWSAVIRLTQSTPGAIKSAQESTAQQDAPADAAEPRPLSFSSGYGP